jgi:hypothetical protein
MCWFFFRISVKREGLKRSPRDNLTREESIYSGEDNSIVFAQRYYTNTAAYLFTTLQRKLNMVHSCLVCVLNICTSYKNRLYCTLGAHSTVQYIRVFRVGSGNRTIYKFRKFL